MIPRGCPPDRTGAFPIASTTKSVAWCPACGASVEIAEGDAPPLAHEADFVIDHPRAVVVPGGAIVGRGIVEPWTGPSDDTAP